MDPCSSTKCSTDIMMLHNVLFSIEWYTCISILFKYSNMSKFDFFSELCAPSTLRAYAGRTVEGFCSIERADGRQNRSDVQLIFGRAWHRAMIKSMWKGIQPRTLFVVPHDPIHDLGCLCDIEMLQINIYSLVSTNASEILDNIN
jgi:hypothetical protein